MTKIEKLFGEGVKLKDLTPEQKVELNRFYKKEQQRELSEDVVKEICRVRCANYRDNHREDYREYQREYRRWRLANDPEFRERVAEHNRRYYEKKRRKAA